ncbi:MAG: DUF4197 domain-containing protein [Alphaproteobacteria bacterium]|nr:DUF4197 domain-containing protein [Alphaproteobacteria bacterium]
MIFSARLLAILVIAFVVISPQGQMAAQGSVWDALKGLGGSSGGTGGLGQSEIAAGLREALKVGTERVVGQVGAEDGFNADPQIHIPLPGALKNVQSVLRGFGMGSLADDLELRMNRAAEAAAPEAKQLFFQAISEMTLDDVQQIYNGPDDAATRYFQGKMSPPLAERMVPIVDRTLADVGAIRTYDEMIAQYKAVPFVPDVKADMTKYVVEKAMDGLFHYVAVEEAAIRRNPAKRTTELLQRVFGAR